MDEQHAIDAIRTDIRDFRGELRSFWERNDDAHDRILKELACDRERIARLEVGQQTLVRSVNALVRADDALTGRLNRIDIAHAVQRGKSRKIAATIGGAIAAAVVAIVELVRHIAR